MLCDNSDIATKDLRRGLILEPKLLKDATLEAQEDSKEVKLTRKGPSTWPLLSDNICLMEIDLVLLMLSNRYIDSY